MNKPNDLTKEFDFIPKYIKKLQILVNHVYTVPNDILAQFIETLKEWKEIFENIPPTIILT